jgi:hypothetical protein
MLDNSCLPIVSQQDSYELHFMLVELQQILHFLFGRGLTAILLVGGLAVECQQNGLLVPVYCVFVFVRLQRARLPIKTKNTW